MDGIFDAVVVGAGPAGASVATLLARAGWRVALIEKQLFPRRKVCGECIAASNLPLLDALGVDVGALGGPELQRAAWLHGPHAAAAPLPAAAHARHRFGRALGRETLDTLLLARARAAGATLLQPWTVLALDGAAGDHRCTLRGPAGQSVLLRARVAVLAHGSWQPLPGARAQRREARRPGDLFAFKANFHGAKLAAGLLPVLAFRGGYGGMVVADGGVLTLACCVRADRLDALRTAAPGLAAGDVVEAMLRSSCAGVAAALDGAQRDGPWLASGPLDPGVRLRGDDCVLRVGNAAGEAHPIIGEGMSMALQSAWLLCDRLLARRHGSVGNAHADAHANPDADADAAWHAAVARDYAAAWRRHFALRLRLAAVLAHAAMRPSLAVAVLSAVARCPALLTTAARWCGKVRAAPDAELVARVAARFASGAPAAVGHRPRWNAIDGALPDEQSEHSRQSEHDEQDAAPIAGADPTRYLDPA